MVRVIDLPREDAVAAVNDLQIAGIKVKIITDDHIVTALAIGSQLGISDDERVLTGQEFEAMDDGQLQQMVNDIYFPDQHQNISFV